MSKCQASFTGNFTTFFSNAGKTENVPEFEFEDFIKSSLGDFKHVTFIL